MKTIKQKLNIKEIRKNFPVLKQKINDNPLVYFDNATTTQKPLSVIKTINEYYTTYNSNIHRGVHSLSQKATLKFEEARKKVQKFINAKHLEEIIFTKGTSESINLVADAFLRKFAKNNDEVIITAMEHHSNIVPWHIAKEKYGIKLKIIPFNEKGELILNNLKNLISKKTKLISLVYTSNTLGTINPVKEIIKTAHNYEIPVLLDAAQAMAHLKVDVQDLNCDFLAFSGHKMYASTGIGVLYGKKELLNKIPPYQGGGEMIKEVTLDKTTFNELPFKLEAGTPPIAQAISLIPAIDFINSIDIENIYNYENCLLNYASEKMQSIKGLKIIGNATHKCSIISFIIENVHHYDLGTILDKYGIAVRTGHHCTQPIMNYYKIPGTTRVSFAIYNSKEEIDYFVECLNKAIKMLL